MLAIQLADSPGLHIEDADAQWGAVGRSPDLDMERGEDPDHARSLRSGRSVTVPG